MRCDAGIDISATTTDRITELSSSLAMGTSCPTRRTRVESLILGEHDETRWATGRELGRAYRIHDAAGVILYTLSAFPRGLSLDGLKVVVDQYNGAAYKVAPEVFHGLAPMLSRSA